MELAVDLGQVLKIIQENPQEIANFHPQYPALCEMDIQLDWNALTLIKDQTPEIRCLAISQNPEALELIGNQTRKDYIFAVSKAPEALQFVKDP